MGKPEPALREACVGRHSPSWLGAAVPATGQSWRTLRVALGSADGIGHYTARIEISSSIVDLGEVDLAEFASQPTAEGEAYRLTASRVGLLTIEAFRAQPGP